MIWESVTTCAKCGAKNRLKTATQDQVPVCGQCKNPLPWIVMGNDAGFQNELQTSIPVLVDFWAEWCAPCRITAPIIDALAGDKAGRIKILKINVDQNPETARRYNVRSIPTMILFIKGNAVETLVGALSKEALLAQLGQYL